MLEDKAYYKSQNLLMDNLYMYYITSQEHYHFDEGEHD